MHSHLYFRIMEYVADFMSVVPPVLIAAVVYLLARRLWLKRRGLPRKNWGNETVRLLLVCWLAGLLALVWTPANFWLKLSYLFRYGWPIELGDWLFRGGFSLEITVHQQFAEMLAGGSWQLAGNVLLYVPLGFLLPLVWKRANWWRVTAIGLLASVVTELGQPVVGRSFDVDDLIANTLGALTGYLLFALVWLIVPKAVEKCRNGQKKQTPVE